MVNVQVFTSPQFLLKILELVLGAVCMGLISGLPPAMNMEKQEVVHATYFGFFIVTAIVAISYILDTPVHVRLVMLISGCAVVMYVVSAALNFELYDKSPYKTHLGRILGAGIVALINAVVYVGDLILSWKYMPR